MKKIKRLYKLSFYTKFDELLLCDYICAYSKEEAKSKFFKDRLKIELKKVFKDE